MPLSLDQSLKIIQGANQKATELGVRVTIAVVDAGGRLIALQRMDGAAFPTTEIAPGKAFTAASFGAESAQLAERMGQVPFFASGPQLAGGRMTLLPGGIPIREGNQVVGAVGVAGATGEQDVECARAGLAGL